MSWPPTWRRCARRGKPIVDPSQLDQSVSLPDLRAGPGLHRDAGLVQHPGRPVALDERPARQGRADRLLDLHLHQLHPHAALPRGVAAALRARRLYGRRRPLARVPVREGRRQRPGRDPAEPPHLPGRPGQRPGDLGCLGQPVLAGGISGRRAGQRPRRALRRGRATPRPSGRSAPCCATRVMRTSGRGHGRRRRRPRRRDHARDLPRCRPRPAAGSTARSTPATRTSARRPAELPRNSFAYAGGWGITDEDATSGAGAGIDLEFNARRVFLVLGSPDKARRSRSSSTASRSPPARWCRRPRRAATIQAQRLYRLVDLPAVGRHRLSLLFDARDLGLRVHIRVGRAENQR